MEIKSVDEAIKMARAYVDSGKSKTALAKASGVHRNTINSIGPGWTPTMRTIKKIAGGLETLG